MLSHPPPPPPSFPGCQATTKGTRERAGGNHPGGYWVGLGFLSLKILKGKVTLAWLQRQRLAVNIAFHEHWFQGKWCISIITKINAFTDFKLASELFLGLSCSPSFLQMNNLRSSSIEVTSLYSGRFHSSRYSMELLQCLWGSLL